MSSFFNYLMVVPKEVGAALVAGSATIIVSTWTIVIGKYYERKREREALHRDKKVEIYDDFLSKFFKFFFESARNIDNQSEDAVKFLREFMTKLLLWSDPETINSFVVWKEHIAKGKPDAHSIFLTEKFLLAIRKDLGKNNRGIKKGFFAQLFLKNGNLLMEAAFKNPNVTLAEVAQIEKRENEQNSK